MRSFAILYPIISIVLFANSLYAQNTALVQGKIIDSITNQAVDFASVSLLLQSDSRPVKGTQTTTEGGFRLEALPAGIYLLRVGFVGYSEYERHQITLTEGQQLNLGTIKLKPAAENVLQEVVIEGTPPDMQLGIDRKVFNVAQSLVSAGGSASDLLANVPSLQVDMDGAVSLRGSGARILIDGKPSAIGGSDIGQLLQSMPANSIERIEVITNPSSKYDPEGQSGIINIILKKNIRTGLNGMANISGGSYNNYNGGLNLNYRDNRFNYFGDYNVRRNNRPGNGATSTLYYDGNGLIDNTAENEQKGLSHSAKLGVDYYAGDKTTIGLSGNISVRGNERGEDLYYRYENLQSPVGTSHRFTDQDEDDFGYDLNLDFKRDFNHTGENLMANFAYGRETEEGNQTFNQNFSDPGEIGENRLNDAEEKTNNINIQLDYTRPFNEDSRLEAGYRSSIRNENNYQFSQLFNQADDVFIPDYNQSNNFELEEIVHAVYANYQNKLTDKLGFQVGLRAEQAYLNTLYTSLDPEASPDERDQQGKLDYFRVYPSIYLTQQFSDKQQLQLSYSRRVSRPRGWQVNPFEDISDNYNIRRGNPNLRPEDIHSIELSYAYFWNKFTLTSSVYTRVVNDVAQMVTERADEATNQTYSTWMNISKSQNTGAELIGKWNIGNKADITGNFNLFYRNLDGAPDYGVEPTKGTSWNANVNGNVKIIPGLSAQVRADYRAPQVMAQGRMEAMYGVDAALKLDVLKSKGSLMLNVRDVFNQRGFGGNKYTNQFIQNFEHRWMRRMANLTFSYRFGRQDFNQKDNKKEEPQLEEMEQGF